MIEFKNVCKVYKENTVINNINMTIEDGEFVVLIGGSGCGKTTTLKMINRLIEPTSGDILVNGKKISEVDPVALRRQMGYVIQQIGLFPHMTIRENIELILRLQKAKPEVIEQNARRLLEMVNLDPDLFLDKYPSEMSGGQQQRVGVVRAFMTDPDIILMDEPFSALDPITRTQIQDALLDMQSTLKKTIVFVTHDMDEAIKLADKICIMKDGNIEQYDTPEHILKHPANDFVRGFIGEKRIWTSPEFIKTHDIMISEPICCHPDTTLLQCITKMNDARVDSLMVIDHSRNLVGIILGETLIGQENVHKTAQEVMTTDFVSVRPYHSIVDLLALFDEKKFSTLPVTDDDGKIQGLVTRSTLINTLSKQFLNSPEREDDKA